MVERVLTAKSSQEDMLPYQLMTKINDKNVLARIGLTNDEYLNLFFATHDDPELYLIMAEFMTASKLV